MSRPRLRVRPLSLSSSHKAIPTNNRRQASPIFPQPPFYNPATTFAQLTRTCEYTKYFKPKCSRDILPIFDSRSAAPSMQRPSISLHISHITHTKYLHEVSCTRLPTSFTTASTCSREAFRGGVRYVREDMARSGELNLLLCRRCRRRCSYGNLMYYQVTKNSDERLATRENLARGNRCSRCTKSVLLRRARSRSVAWLSSSPLTDILPVGWLANHICPVPLS